MSELQRTRELLIDGDLRPLERQGGKCVAWT
jgi:hypothetical protein